MKLVIVESPTKQKTIQKYLGEDYKVAASIGHIRDLAMDGKYNLGVDIENGEFTPRYVILNGKEKVVEKLKKLADEADFVYLASDPDREGEAISWHLVQTLGLKEGSYKRLEFHEITRHSIQNAINDPRDLYQTRVDAQETRRIIDRILGFRISFVLSRDTGAPSAGRVQSATLKLVYDRTKERENFVPTTSYYLSLLIKDKNNNEVQTYLVDEKGEKIAFSSEKEVFVFINKLGNCLDFSEETIETKTISSKPPFSLSELYQAANAMYHYSTKTILATAKKLFEEGMITYPRTDSHRLAPEFINATKAYIQDKYGEDYVGVAKGQGHTSGAQDAHEALRPTDLKITPDQITGTYAKNIYRMIYQRVVQSIMKPMIINEHKYVFTCNGSTFVGKLNEIVFDGYSAADAKKTVYAPLCKFENKAYEFERIDDSYTTKAPVQYTEGTLVKKMEDTGIGRPSTYATTVSTLFDRGYIENDNGYLKITKTGVMVAEYLSRHFPSTVVNIDYTSDMEKKLDLIEDENREKLDILTQANNSFLVEFDSIVKNPEPVTLKTGEKCPICGGDLVYKHNKFGGEFIGCSNYPDCNYVKMEETGEMCPDCGHPLIYRYSKTGKFIGCSNFPNCKFMKPVKTKFTFKKKK